MVVGSCTNHFRLGFEVKTEVVIDPYTNHFRLDFIVKIKVVISPLEAWPEVNSAIFELSTSDADVLKNFGKTYKAIIRQISLCNDSKAEKKKNVDQELEVS